MILPFGKHRSQLISDVPIDYLLWLVEQTEYGERFKRTIQDEIDRRGYYREKCEAYEKITYEMASELEACQTKLQACQKFIKEVLLPRIPTDLPLNAPESIINDARAINRQLTH
jgi:hypothetical protein